MASASSFHHIVNYALGLIRALFLNAWHRGAFKTKALAVDD
jgi:hypothetical protein